MCRGEKDGNKISGKETKVPRKFVDRNVLLKEDKVFTDIGSHWEGKVQGMK